MGGRQTIGCQSRRRRYIRWACRVADPLRMSVTMLTSSTSAAPAAPTQSCTARPAPAKAAAGIVVIEIATPIAELDRVW